MRYAMGKLRSQPAFTPLLRLVLLCPALLVLCGVAAHGMSMRPHRPGHADQQQILRIDDQMRTALLGADTGALDKILADDFLGISANGTLSDKQQYLRRIGRHEHQFTRIDITDRKVRIQASSAVVVTTADVTGKLDSNPLTGTFRYTRVYSREPDGSWKLRNFEATRVFGAGADEMRHGEPVARVR
ncbi:nuclear transport factor 2 family protein [Terriglobus aquaticus]|uniref:Nuclear transport factor 2 family protein n=1 Tax=Terriglobus aquaticus TaxID=940139 RepID=A0ABW9KI36_9BACT|nr:nuclear transport factor 2 family protein [Terriglobus aquaticus]